MSDSPSTDVYAHVLHGLHRRPRATLAMLVVLTGAAAMLTACTGSPRTDQPMENFENPFAGILKNPFHGPTEAGFLDLAGHYCSDFSIGNQSVGGLLAGDQAFRTLTTKLYSGDISNDEYINQVQELHPADDANIPATGCIIDQLQNCYNGPCEVTAGDGTPPPPQQPRALDPDVDAATSPRPTSAQLDAMGPDTGRDDVAVPTPLP